MSRTKETNDGESGDGANAPADSPPADGGGRSLDFDVEVVGTPEEVWAAIATGPGISSWYVPHTVEERRGGAATARFGPGQEMEVPGRVAEWEPPRRVVFDGGDGVEGLAFEWTIEARNGGTCIVRLVNSGFGSGADWDGMYDGMRDGWPLFLLNLQLHRRHFPGQHATAMLPSGSWSVPPERALAVLLDGLGLDHTVAPGDRIDTIDGDAPDLAGTVVDVAANRLALVIDRPATGTAFLAAERGHGPDSAEVSVWAYLYGPDRDDVVSHEQASWSVWLADRA